MNRVVLLFNFFLIIIILSVSGCKESQEYVIAASDGVKISFTVTGDGIPAIVLIHGWSNTRAIWDIQISHFSEKYKVISIDLPGFGKSGNNRQEWTMARLGEDVTTVIKTLNLEKIVLVGFSMGGPVAIESANSLPGQVAGVILVDNMQNVEMKFPAPFASFMDSIMWDLVTNPTKEKMMAGGFFRMNPDTAFPRVMAMLKDAPMTGWRELLAGFMQWHNEDKEKSLQECKVPVTAINSDMEPTNVEAFKELIPSYQAKIVPGVGHVIMWDAPEKFNQLLEESIQEFMK